MRKLLIGLAALVVLLVAVVIAIPYFVPLDAVRDRMVEEVKAATGRDLSIGGPVGLSVFPSVAIELSDVSLSNPPGAGRPSIVTLGELDVEVGLFPLLSGEIVVQRLIVREPVIALEIDEAGRGNWIFDPPERDRGTATAEQSPASDGTTESDGGLGLSALRLGEVGIVDGTILYENRATGQSFEATQLALSIELESLESPLDVSGRFTFQERQVDLALSVGHPSALLSNGSSPLAVAVSSDAIDLTVDGELQGLESPEINGRVSASVPSVADLTGWLGLGAQGDGLPIEAVRMESELALTATAIVLQTATLTVDENAASGDLSVGLDGPRPSLFGRLAVDQLNLDPFLGEADGKAAESDVSGAEESAGAGEWSDEPIDFGALMLADADLVIASEGVTLRGMEAGPSLLTLRLENGALDFDLSRTSLFGGHVALQLGANAASGTPSIRIGLQVDEVEAEPVLSSLYQFDRLTGASSAELDLRATGRSQRALVEAMNGTGTVVFRDGTIKGINLAAMVRNVASAFTDPTAGEQRSTDFAEAGASLRVTNGVVRSDDIRLLAPLLRLEGAGRAELVPQSLSVRMVPKLVGTAEGQGGTAQLAGLAVPVIIEGPFDNLTYRPDLESVITNTLQDPEAVRQQLEGVADQLQEGGSEAATDEAVRTLLEGLTGGAPQGDSSGDSSSAPSPADAIRSLLGQ